MMDMMNQNLLKELTILYIEDENNIRQNITKTLNMLVHKVIDCGDALEALEIFEKNNIDIILSDINLPQLDGLEFCQKIRQKDEYIPIILLTAHLKTEYLLQATKLKLIDYLIKPVNFDTLLEVLQKAAKEIIKQGRFEIYFDTNTVYNLQKKCLYNNHQEIPLTHNEITLLEFLIQEKQRVVSSDEIKTIVWQDSFDATDSALKNLLNKLRKKIGKECIANISGVGYRLTPSV